MLINPKEVTLSIFGAYCPSNVQSTPEVEVILGGKTHAGAEYC